MDFGLSGNLAGKRRIYRDRERNKRNYGAEGLGIDPEAWPDKEVQYRVVMDDVLKLLDFKIDYDANGNEKSRSVRQTVKNFETVLENDGRIAGVIRFNEFSQEPYLVGSTPWQTDGNRAWGSYDDSALFSILQSEYGLKNRNDFYDALKNVSMRGKFHPVRDVLDSLQWNGNEGNIRSLLVNYLGCEDNEFNFQSMRLWMKGAVARVNVPGIKFDYTLILQGPQGLGKSTMLRLMALRDSWFNDSLDNLDSDRAAGSVLGSWIIELSELKALARTGGGMDSVKRFLTATQDKMRLPYERRADVFQRQCVFAGTTNKNDFLTDETGNRRFLIIKTGINKPTKNLFSPEAMEDVRQAWAEAVHIWKTEDPQLILPDSCREEAQKLQMDYMADDGKAGIIAEYLDGKQRTCAVEVWQRALKEQGRPQKWQTSEINTIIESLPDWERMSSPAKFGDFGSQRGFQRVSRKESPLHCSSGEDDCSNDFMTVTPEQLAELPFT